MAINLLFAMIALFCSPVVLAGKIHKAHVHGVAELSLAYEGNMLSVELVGPADGFLGFEHAPKTAEEKKKLEELKNNWSSKFQDVLSISGLDDCTVKDATLELELDGKHAEVRAIGTLACANPVKGRKVEVNLPGRFPHLEKVNFKLLRHDGTAVNKKLGKKSESVEL